MDSLPFEEIKLGVCAISVEFCCTGEVQHATCESGFACMNCDTELGTTTRWVRQLWGSQRVVEDKNDNIAAYLGSRSLVAARVRLRKTFWGLD